MLRNRDVKEESVAYITASFFSKSGQPVTPVSARYRLDDVTRGVKSAREILGWTDIALIATSYEFTITDQQNAIIDGCNSAERKQITVEVIGSDGLPTRDVYEYQVINLAGTD